MATESLQVIAEATENISKAMGQIGAATQAAQSSMDEMQDELNQLALSSKVADQGLDSLSQSELKAAAAAKGLDVSVDQAGEELREFTRDASAATAASEALSISIGSLSFNFAAFTVALRDLATQVPVLVTTIGSLVSVLGGLTAAATAAGAAMSGLFVGGMVAMAEEIAAQSSEIEGTMQGMQEVMSSVGDLFRQAFEPLVDSEAISFFKDAVTWMAEMINVFAQWVDQMFVGNAAFEQFLSTAGEIVQSGFVEVLEAMAFAFRTLRPELLAVLDALTSGLADAIVFFTEITDKMSNQVGDSVSEIIAFTEELIRLGSSALGGVMPIIVAFLTVVEEVSAALNALGQEGVAAIAMFIATAAAINKLANALAAGIGIGTRFAGTLDEIVANAGSLGGVVQGSASAMTTALGEALGGVENLGVALFGASEDGIRATGRLQRAVDGTVDVMIRGFTRSADSAASLGATLTDTSLLMSKFEGAANAAAAAAGRYGTQFAELLNKTARSVGLFDDGLQVLGDFGVSMQSFNDAALRAADAVGAQATRLADWLNAVHFGNTQIIRNTAATIKNTAANIKNAASKALNTTRTWAAAAATSAYAAAQSLATSTTGALTIATIGLAAALSTIGWTQIILALTAIAAVGGIAVGVLGNMQGATSGAGRAFEFIKNAIMGMVQGALPTFMSFWNMLVSIFNAIVQPVVTLFDGIMKIAQALGLVSESADEGVSTFNVLKTIVQAIFLPFKLVFDIIGAIAGLINTVLVTAIELVVDIITSLINVSKNVINWFAGIATAIGPLATAIDFLIGMVQTLIGWFLQIPAAIGGAFDMVEKFLLDMINTAIDFLNGLIDAVNKIPGVNIGSIDKVETLFGSAKVDEEEVTRGAQRAAEAGGQAIDRFTGQPSANLNYEDVTNNNVEEINARPEDKERLKRIVKDAMDEANTFRRQSDGYSG